MPVSAVWSPLIKAMMFPHLAERHTLRKNIGSGICLDFKEFFRIRRIQWGSAPQVANMGMTYKPGDQALQTDPLLSVDRDPTCAKDDTIFLLPVADDNALFPVSI